MAWGSALSCELSRLFSPAAVVSCTEYVGFVFSIANPLIHTMKLQIVAARSVMVTTPDLNSSPMALTRTKSDPNAHIPE